MAQSQEEFYFSLPYDRMDLCMYGLNNGVEAEEVAAAAGLTAEQLEAVWGDIARKRVATQYLHLSPITI
jgi:NAD+ synthase